MNIKDEVKPVAGPIEAAPDHDCTDLPMEKARDKNPFDLAKDFLIRYSLDTLASIPKESRFPTLIGVAMTVFGGYLLYNGHTDFWVTLIYASILFAGVGICLYFHMEGNRRIRAIGASSAYFVKHISDNTTRDESHE